MNEATPPKEERVAALNGLGTSRKRVEDARFTQGKGNYVDDLKLPGMLFGDFVRSPYAHARVKAINTEKALALPGVHAVLTAADLEPLGLHWMPTLAGDKQMVLADGKVLFQGQEVAFVVADDRYAASDGVAAFEVEYEELPVLVDPFKAETSDAPVLRGVNLELRAGEIYGIAGVGGNGQSELAGALMGLPEPVSGEMELVGEGDTLGRKWRELLVALQLESRFSKRELLLSYLNRVYLGVGWGFEDAARTFFALFGREYERMHSLQRQSPTRAGLRLKLLLQRRLPSWRVLERSPDLC